MHLHIPPFRLSAVPSTFRLCVLLALLVGCTPKPKPSTDTRQEHPAALAVDSALANSRIPGATGVKRAMSIRDSAAARRERVDSISNAVP
jgi:hypothetical protein